MGKNLTYILITEIIYLYITHQNTLTMKKLTLAIFVLLAMNCFSQINLEWNKRSSNFIPNNLISKNQSVAIDSYQNIYTAICYKQESQKENTLNIIKYSNTGNKIWEKEIFINISSGIDITPCFIKALSSGTITVVYNFIDSTNFNKIGVLMYNQAGNLIHQNVYGGTNSESCYANSICTDKYGSFYITGYFSNGSSAYCNTIGFDSTGNYKWAHRFPQYSYGNDITADSLGYIYMCGSADTMYSNKPYTLTVKYDNTGNLIWKRFFGFVNGTMSGYDIATKITLDDSLNVIIGGTAFVTGYQFVVVKYNKYGVRKWYRLNSTLMGVDDITTDSKCNVYASGYQEESTGKVIKYDANGNQKNMFYNDNEYISKIKFYKTNFIYSLGGRHINNQDLLTFSILDTNLITTSYYIFDPDSSNTHYWASLCFDNYGSVYAAGIYNYNISTFNYFSNFFISKLSQTLGITNISNGIPDKFSLSQNYPNPFNPSTNIKYQIAKNSFVTLKVFDILGKEIATLVNEKQNSGTYESTFDARGLTSGVYFYRLTAGDFSETKKMLMIK